MTTPSEQHAAIIGWLDIETNLARQYAGSRHLLPVWALLRQQADEALGYCASDGNYNRWNAALAALYAATVGGGT